MNFGQGKISDNLGVEATFRLRFPILSSVKRPGLQTPTLTIRSPFSCNVVEDFFGKPKSTLGRTVLMNRVAALLRFVIYIIIAL